LDTPLHSLPCVRRQRPFEQAQFPVAVQSVWQKGPICCALMPAHWPKQQPVSYQVQSESCRHSHVSRRSTGWHTPSSQPKPDAMSQSQSDLQDVRQWVFRPTGPQEPLVQPSSLGQSQSFEHWVPEGFAPRSTLRDEDVRSSARSLQLVTKINPQAK
jgi:hypothetical protein